MIPILLSCFTIMVSAVPVSSLVYWLCLKKKKLCLLFSRYVNSAVTIIIILEFFDLFFQIDPNVLPSLLSQGEATEAASQKPDAQMPAPLPPKVEQPQPGVSQQPDPHGGSHLLPPTQHYAWSPLGGSPMFIPLQPSLHRSQPAHLPALPQWPLVGHEEKRPNKTIYFKAIFNFIVCYFLNEQ